MNDLKFLKKQDPSTANDFPESILQIRTDSIRPNHAQPRARFDHNSILRLADSIRRYGILQPLTVRRSPDDTIYDYELIAGERRLRAAKMLGYYTVPCILIEADERMTAEMAIIENLLREDLNMFEQAYGFQKLIENHHLTQEDVARRLSLSQSAVANKLRLLKLSLEEQNLILECALTERHARALLKISDPAVRSELIRKIAAEKWNVRESERYIDAICAGKTAELQETLRRNGDSAIEEVLVASARSENSENAANAPAITLDNMSKESEESIKPIVCYSHNISGNVETSSPMPASIPEILQSFRRRVETLQKGGRETTMNISETFRSLEITIRIAKQ